MAIASLRNVLRYFQGGAQSETVSADLVKEALLMTLARATKSDSKIGTIEVSTVQRVIREATGDELSEADIRIAASAALFESTSLQSALAKLRPGLTAANRGLIAQSLAEVIRSDQRISELELDFFDSVANALGMRPSEIAGLLAADSGAS